LISCPSLNDATASTAIIGSVITMGRDKGMTVVAEGVETLIQRDVLRSLGCEAAQGWFYGRPTTSTDLAARLTRRNQRAIERSAK
jgi:EAL domain-containing protein (putative c-di-GMP-specific phosphodiesterase class I)